VSCMSIIRCPHRRHCILPGINLTVEGILHRVKLSKAQARPLALTFPDTSLFIKAVRRLERKIDEKLRSSARRRATNR
jgi:hypothetical protein